MKLTKLDKKILYQLDINARQSNQQLARKLRTSKEVIAYRIKKLEDTNIIRGYHTIIDTSKLGYYLYRVFLKLVNVNQLIINQMIDFLKKEKSVWWIGDLEGRWDFLFGVWAKDPKNFKNFFDRFNLKFRKYINERLVSILLSYQHYDQAYLIKNERNNFNYRSVGYSKPEKVDGIDLKLLKLISDDARIQVIKLAKELKLKSSTILYRLRNLEKKEIIKGYRPILNFNLLDYEFYVVKLNINDFNKLNGLKQFVLLNPNVTDIIETIAGYDFDFDMMINDSTQYHKFIKDIKNKFPIIDIEFFRVLNNYKLVYFPDII